MKSYGYRVTLLADTVISQRSATAGDHQCLDYLPGASFLGTCAGQLYNELGDDAWTVFHSGKVRFHNALPLTPFGQLGVPMPLAFHKPKYPKKDGGEKLHNLSRAKWDAKSLGQPKQQREGFLIKPEAGPGECSKKKEPSFNPIRFFRLKTAIDREKGNRSKDGQLFGYQYLAAGSQWYLQVDLDSDLPESLGETLDRCLTGKRLRIGRSRSAEFGGVRIQPVRPPELPAASATGRQLLVYCLSDLALRDEGRGMPCLRPTTGLLRLPEGRFDEESSYLRFRSYAPFNSYRGANDLERQVIVAGSVLAFKLEEELTDRALHDCQGQLDLGVGDYRQDGLGQLWLNPPFLHGETLEPIQIASLAEEVQGVTPAVETDLTSWMKCMASEQELVRQARENARRWLDKEKGLRNLKNGPSCSQWRELGLRAGSADGREALREQLFGGQKGLCMHGVSGSDWSKEHRFGQSFTEFLMDIVDPKGGSAPLDDELLCLSLAHLGRLAASKLRQEVK